MNEPSPATTMASFELTVAPEITTTPTVRRFVGELCARSLANPEAVSKVVVALHELLDNALRCASRASAAVRVDIARVGNEVAVTIVTRNRTDRERWQRLERLLEEMRTTSDRATFFQTLLDRVARGNEDVGLGLGRVYAEAEFQLSGRYDGDEVVVGAEARFPMVSP